MNEEYFDLAIIGTTLNDLDFPIDNKKIVVIDDSGKYGTSYTSLSDLKISKYISDLYINKGNDENKFIIEALPFLLGISNPIVKKYRKKFMDEDIEYIEVPEILFIDKNIYKILQSKNDILILDLCNEDKFYLYSLYKNRDLLEFKNNFTDKSHFIYKAFVEMEIFSEKDFDSIFSSLNKPAFVYPKHGYTEICESISFLNALKGTTYLINKEVSYSLVNGEYPHKFVCKLGTIYSKNVVSQKLSEGRYYIRIILISKKILKDKFLVFIKLNIVNIVSTNNDSAVSDTYVKVIGLDESCGVCENGMQIIYLIKKYSMITDTELGMLEIRKDDVLLDVSYVTNYSIEQFN